MHGPSNSCILVITYVKVKNETFKKHKGRSILKRIWKKIRVFYIIQSYIYAEREGTTWEPQSYQN